MNFRYCGHGIDFDVKDPEIEINGAASRAIFRLDGRRNTPYGNKRGVLVDLAPTTTAAAALRHRVAKTVTCNDIPATVPADAGQLGVRRLLPAGRAVRRHLGQLHHALNPARVDIRWALAVVAAVLLFPSAAGAATVKVQGEGGSGRTLDLAKRPPRRERALPGAQHRGRAGGDRSGARR